MKSKWNPTEAAKYPGDLNQRVYSSRLLGNDPSLVLHGGGNTSVKVTETDLFGQPEGILYVKGSGWDLATIKAEGFSPVRLAPTIRLAELPTLSDPDMANALRSYITRAGAPAPSVETILHAILPHKFVDHTHADSLIALSNTPSGPERLAEIYSEVAVIIPYVMPGFKLARLCAELYPQHATDKTIGMVLLNHGLFSFGETAQESYERMIQLVTLAEDHLKAKQAWRISYPHQHKAETYPRLAVAELRHTVSKAAGRPMVMTTQCDDHSLAFARRPDVADLSQQGPLTPDHVLRTKRVPLLGRDVESFVEAYQQYFETQAAQHPAELTMLDPAPRVILDADLGVCAIGKTVKAANMVSDLYRHSIKVISQADKLERYQALPASDIFEVEYWDLEQAKLRRAGAPPQFGGEVVLVTGAASGIGLACVDAFRQMGAAVVALDINPAITEIFYQPEILGVHGDVSDPAVISHALDVAVSAFGGVDMLVLNAGIFPASTPVGELSLETWQKTMRVNLDANLSLLNLAHPLLKLAPNGGRVAVIGSKNVPAPGPGAAAYSTSKAALTQLARVAALEWGADNIRVNILHPNAVFDTGIWSDSVLEARAKHYGLSVEAYKRNNVLHTNITSHHVAELAVAVCGPLFAQTTGAQIPIDGGNERVI